MSRSLLHAIMLPLLIFVLGAAVIVDMGTATRVLALALLSFSVSVTIHQVVWDAVRQVEFEVRRVVQDGV